MLIDAHSVIYRKKDRPMPLVQLFSLAKGIVTGTPPKVTDMRSLERGRAARARASSGEKASSDA